ncbi:hypothetical protein LIER_17784 [Lithospermum erythrorhizon]|uniref:WAT1-related protein n=1 Tax=Lithospermum erythrorhizon TaxID=34254 RepID=A0AAV3QDD5_LITER
MTYRTTPHYVDTIFVSNVDQIMDGPCHINRQFEVIYAGMALLSKVAVAQGMNTYVFVTYRLTFATISLAPFALFLEKKNADPLTYNILWKTFLVSFFGVTLSLNLYCVALKYTTATLAAATTNTIPAITFVIASILRVESVSITQRHGMAKVLGSTLSVSGALVFAFVKGPLIDFLNLSKRTTHYNESSVGSGMELVKGALVMLAANTFWSLWLIMQVHLRFLQSLQPFDSLVTFVTSCFI